MLKKRIAIFSGIVILVFAVIFTAVSKYQNNSKIMTFAECEKLGGTAWLVDLYHPEICPSCAEYRVCENQYNDYSEVCPDCYGPCQECQDQYSLFESCPACYGPCQECENEYRNDFKNDEERTKLCPECEVCDNCREALNEKIINCPPCVSCAACKEKNKKYIDIRDVCPQVLSCSACMEETGIYPEQCPDGREKIGEISDAAIWFQCCK